MVKKELTPMMKQFFDLKAKHPEAILLFRCGDFYETYCEDAITAAQILGITLTRRNNGAGVRGDEMAGFPHHALDTYLPKLIRAGKRVAICDQLEDPKAHQKVGQAWYYGIGDFLVLLCRIMCLTTRRIISLQLYISGRMLVEWHFLISQLVSS